MLTRIYVNFLENRALAKIPENWTKLLPSPPSDMSVETRRELKQVKRMANNKSRKDLEFIRRIDKDPAASLKDILKRYNLKFPNKDFTKIYKILDPIILKLKNHFNRSRPYDLDKSIQYVKSKTHRHPAYPSGHVSYAALAEKMLSELYPQHSSKFKREVKEVGKARMLMGVHYMSDNRAGEELVDKLWPTLKKEIE